MGRDVSTLRDEREALVLVRLWPPKHLRGDDGTVTPLVCRWERVAAGGVNARHPKNNDDDKAEKINTNTSTAVDVAIIARSLRGMLFD